MLTVDSSIQTLSMSQKERDLALSDVFSGDSDLRIGSLYPTACSCFLFATTGESVSIQMLDGNETILRGPATITMVSQHNFPPVPMPVQVGLSASMSSR